MILSFYELCEQLQLTPYYEQGPQLQSLEDWCEKNISQDVRYTGNETERYRQYFALAADFLDNFIASMSSNLTLKMTESADFTALQYAAEHGYDRFISDLPNISRELLDARDVYGMTSLHTSAVEGFVFTVRALIIKGADARLANQQKAFPLQSALFVPLLHDDGLIARKELIFNALLAYAPEIINSQDRDGNTVLHQMAAHKYDGLMRQILSTHPKLALIPNDCTHYPVHTAILNHQTEALQQLMPIEGVADQVDATGQTSLHYAARYGTGKMVTLCCQGQKDLNRADCDGKTPLIRAAEAGNQEALETLFQQGADTGLADRRGFSILHHAVRAQNEPMVEWIVQNAPRGLKNLADSAGNTPLFYAEKSGNPCITALLKNIG